jgi:hypothetical protein
LKKKDIFSQSNETMIFEAVSAWLARIAPNKRFADKETACVVLLIFPMFGPTIYSPKSGR